MRHIITGDKKPEKAWLDKAAALLVRLEAAPDKAARDKLIDDHSALWGELKKWLLSLSHQKCWFSEAKDCFSHWDVEHYRPKKAAKNDDGTEDDGYWWLAFDWMNFRICGNVGNRKKGPYFPLSPGSKRVVHGGDIRYEIPLLLDPVDEDDPNLLSFNLEGEALTAPGVNGDWEKTRVEYSIKRYNLDFPPLKDRRKLIWNECWERIQEYRRELSLYQSDSTNVIAKEKYKESAKYVRKMIAADCELSAVARACILSSGDPRVTALLQTA